MLPHDYRERVYAGWIGKCIGVRLGVPVENWTADEIERNLGEISGFFPLRPGTIFQPDDDTAFPLVLIRALEQFGPNVTPEQIGVTVLNLVADGRGTLWWGGYGRSTEHTAYANLLAGIDAPQSGSAELNGLWLAEQIGGQIFSDIWGLVAPNDPTLAADFAARASCVTHDGAGVDGGRFVAALVSMAFGETDPAALVAAGLKQIAVDGNYANVVRAVVDFHALEPDDWRACQRMLASEWGPDRWGGPVHIIPNAGVVVMALLYSGGNFDRAVQIATMAGWDTDCNAGNVGTIMGVAVGLDGIGGEWRAQLDDTLVCSSVMGTRNLTTIPQCADLFSRLGAQVMGEPEPAALPRYHFKYPGSTQGFTIGGDGGLALSHARDDGGSLKITLRNLNKKHVCRLELPTYIHPKQLSANNYGASFSPLVYPGQTVRAALSLPEDAPAGLLGALFVLDGQGEIYHQAEVVALQPGTQRELQFRIPALSNALLSRVGIMFRTLGQPWSGSILLHCLDWDGVPVWSSNFGSSAPEYGAIAGWTFARGFWRLEDGAYHGSGVGRNETYTGDPSWRDLTLTVDLVPLLGNEHYALLRVGGACSSYAVGLAAKGRLVIARNDGRYNTVASAALPWQHGKRIQLAVTVSGSEIIACVDGTERLRWTDSMPLRAGAIGLANGPGCHTRFEHVSVEGANP